MEYALLVDDRADSLARAVNQKLELRWHLYGNPAMTTVIGQSGNSYWTFAQAVVRYESSTITVALGTDVKHFDVLGEVTIGE